MRLAWIAWGAGAIAAATLVGWGASTLWAPSARRAPAAIAAPTPGEEPELVLRGVELLEGRVKGGAWKVVADEISYSLTGKKVLADRVAIALPSARGDIVLRAPRASWDTAAGRIRLDAGATAMTGDGLSAAVESGTLDLKDRVFSGGGRASVAGQGFSVAGDNLVWRWADGVVSLSLPKGRIDPAGLPRRKG